MDKMNSITDEIMNERFGKDNVMSLATSENNIPYVRSVNALYYKNSFFIITYALSNKMNQIKSNPVCAISGEWFSASGIGINIGWVKEDENKEIYEKLRFAFKEWIDNGHNDFDDKNCIILKVKLRNGVLFSHGNRYDIDFEK